MTKPPPTPNRPDSTPVAAPHNAITAMHGRVQTSRPLCGLSLQTGFADGAGSSRSAARITVVSSGMRRACSHSRNATLTRISAKARVKAVSGRTRAAARPAGAHSSPITDITSAAR